MDFDKIAARLVDQNIPSLVVGDFNCIDSLQEKRGGRPFFDNIEACEFCDFMRTTRLVDLGFFGPRFTWYNNRQGAARVWERIDRAFATVSLIQMFPTNQVHHLLRITSDHCSVLIATETRLSYRSPFQLRRFRSPICVPGIL